jgi:phosphopantothenoylcysteine decarboxylase/phosphopantothenate--cysteine ligase
LRDAGAGFGTDTNKITIIDRNNKTTPFELKDKQEAAKDITDALLAFVNSKK